MDTLLGPVPSLQQHLRTIVVNFGIPSYNEGAGIVPTLESLWQGMLSLGLESSKILLADSSNTSSTVDAATAWADRRGARLCVDRSGCQRAKKEQLNIIFDRASGDLLICLDADVIIPVPSLAALLSAFIFQPKVEVALGFSVPNPAAQSIRYRAGAWQMRAVALLTARCPANNPSVAGYFWGCRGSFYSTYRYPVASGSIYDDVELSRALVERQTNVLNVTGAVALRTPIGSLREFCLCMQRERVANPEYKKSHLELKAGLLEARADPLGAVLWAIYKLVSVLLGAHFRRQAATEMWQPLGSTKTVKS